MNRLYVLPAAFQSLAILANQSIAPVAVSLGLSPVSPALMFPIPSSGGGLGILVGFIIAKSKYIGETLSKF